MDKDNWLLQRVFSADRRPPSKLAERFAQQYIEAMAKSSNAKQSTSETQNQNKTSAVR